MTILQIAFKKMNPLIDVVGPFSDLMLAPSTEDNMREGQRLLSEALWTGFRNPIQHEEVLELKSSGVFSYQDCLDALSLVSHLQRRVEFASKDGQARGA